MSNANATQERRAATGGLNTPVRARRELGFLGLEDATEPSATPIPGLHPAPPQAGPSHCLLEDPGAKRPEKLGSCNPDGSSGRVKAQTPFPALHPRDPEPAAVARSQPRLAALPPAPGKETPGSVTGTAGRREGRARAAIRQNGGGTEGARRPP